MLAPFGLSNWEMAAFYFIEPFIRGDYRSFTRQQLMKKIDEIIPLLILLGHKQKPTHPEETLQRTLQNMRDKKWIEFQGKGQYVLTQAGCDKLIELKKDLDFIKRLKEGFDSRKKEILNGDLCLVKGKAGSTTV